MGYLSIFMHIGYCWFQSADSEALPLLICGKFVMLFNDSDENSG
jgi:hypothetical protein